MRVYRGVLGALCAVLLVLGLVGCEEKGPAQKAGEGIDEAVKKVGETLEEAGQKVQEAGETLEKKAKGATN